MASSNDTNLNWRSISISAATIILTMLGYWLLEGKNLITREEAKAIVATEGPYIQDRSFIMSKLSDNSKINETMTKTLIDLRIELEKLRGTLDSMNERRNN